MSDALNVIAFLIIMHNITHLVCVATDDCKLQQQYHGEYTCSSCALRHNLWLYYNTSHKAQTKEAINAASAVLK